MVKQERWTLRVPATQQGEKFITQLKRYLNKDSYKVSKMYTGPRPKGTSPYATRKENATSIRIYVDSKREEDNPLRTIEYGRSIQKYQDDKRIEDVTQLLNEAQRRLTR